MCVGASGSGAAAGEVFEVEAFAVGVFAGRAGGEGDVGVAGCWGGGVGGEVVGAGAGAVAGCR